MPTPAQRGYLGSTLGNPMNKVRLQTNFGVMQSRYLPCIVAWAFIHAALCGGAQTFSFDFEGVNGLNGWVQSDGQPVATGPGASGTTALSIAVDQINPERRVYHPIPFDPTKAYRYSAWTKVDQLPASTLVKLAWVDFSTGQMIYTNTYYLSGGYDAWKPAAVPPHFIPTADYSSNPNAQFCIVLEVFASLSGIAWFDDVEVTMSDAATTSFIAARVMLGGTYTNGYMPANLRSQNLLPALEPYTALGHLQAGGGGGETAPEAWWDFNNLDGPVDWVRVELRSAVDPTIVVATRQGFVNSLGSITGVDGGTALVFNVPPGNYHLAVRHRNHLGCMTASPVFVQGAITVPWSSYGFVDFAAAATPVWGTNARKLGDTIYNYMVLWPGNTTGDGLVKYTGANNDRDPILQAIGGTVPTNTLNGVYNTNDVNMDGTVKYTGSFNDRDPILQTIGGTVPTLTKAEQLP